jgi:hypothetical protein
VQEIAVLLSPSELERLSLEWQVDYELGEGDLIVRKGRTTHLSRGMVVARRTSMGGSVPTLKRKRTAYEQVQSGWAATLWGNRTELTISQWKHRALQSQARLGRRV